MANTNTIRLGRNAEDEKQWATKEGGLLAANTKTFTDYSDRLTPVEFDVVRATSATRVNEAGLIETVSANVPRIDFLNDSKGELLVEPQKTNLITQSSDFTAYPTLNATKFTSLGLSPDGITNNQGFYETTNNGVHLLSVDYTSTSNLTYTISAFVKSVGGRNVKLGDLGGSGGNVDFDLSTGTVINQNSGATNAFIEPLLNGWFRIGFTQTKATVLYRIGIYSLDGITSNFIGDVTKGLEVWGVQLEQSSYVTSYIPTNGSSVTRNADVISASNLVLSTNPISIYLEVDVTNFEGIKGLFELNLNRGTTNLLGLDINSNGTLQLTTVSTLNPGNTGIKVATNAIPLTGSYKIALVLDDTEQKVFVNGVQKSFNSGSYYTAFSLNNIDLGNRRNGNLFKDTIRSFIHYSTKLTDVEAIELTT